MVLVSVVFNEDATEAVSGTKIVWGTSRSTGSSTGSSSCTVLGADAGRFAGVFFFAFAGGGGSWQGIP
jgi:hypothetical protein